MSHDRLRRKVGIGLGALALLAAAPALAADLAYPYPPPKQPPGRYFREERVEERGPPPPQAGPALYGPRFADGPRFAPPAPQEACRTVVKRRIDEDGEETVRRVRVCDEAAYPPPRPRYRPTFYDPGPLHEGPPHERRYDGPYEGPPVPPADVPFEGPPRY